MLSVGSLFAGVGGIDLAFQQAGFVVKWANDNDIHACTTYSSNFTHPIIYKDVRDLNVKDLEPVDVITAGFPCQPFSIAGKKKGLMDERGILFFEIMRIVKALQPKVLLLENVKNLKTHENGTTFCKILQEV